MNMRFWTVPSPAAPQPDPDEVSQLRLELAAARIRIAALESSVQQWADLHRASTEMWTAALMQARAALLDLHVAVVRDREAPEDGLMDGAVAQ